MQTSKFILLFSIMSMGLHVSCSVADLLDDQDTGLEQEVGTPVETNSPNSIFQPSFKGQTRIGSVTTDTPIEAIVISTDLTAPWGITNLPDGRLLITQKAGQMRIATTSGGLSGMHIARLVIDSDNKVVGEERLLVEENQRFRDITQGLDNALYAITDVGRLYRIDKP